MVSVRTTSYADILHLQPHRQYAADGCGYIVVAGSNGILFIEIGSQLDLSHDS